jgi:hypothetical protein
MRQAIQWRSDMIVNSMRYQLLAGASDDSIERGGAMLSCT